MGTDELEQNANLNGEDENYDDVLAPGGSGANSGLVTDQDNNRDDGAPDKST